MLSFKSFTSKLISEEYNNSEGFLFEALTRSQSKIVSGWLSKMKTSPKGPKISSHIPFDESGRLDIPMEVSEKPVQKKELVSPDVESHLKSIGYTPVSSTHAEREIETTIPEGPRKGEVVRKKQQQSIGKILADKPELQKIHAEYGSTAGAKGGKYSIEIRRDPQGVAEMSSGNKVVGGKESWKSCMTLPDTDSADPLDHVGGIHHQYVAQDIKHGTHVSYLIRNGKRVARIALKPFTSEGGHTILRPEPKVYGTQDENGDFQRTISNWAEKNFPMHPEHSIYTINKDLYDDATLNSKVQRTALMNGNLSSNKISSVIKSGDPNAVRSALNAPNVNESHFREAYKHPDVEVRSAALEHPNAPEDILHHAMHKSMDYRLHEAVMRNPNASRELIQKGLNHFTSTVKATAINNRNAKEEDVRPLLNDKDEYVRNSAQKRLKRIETARKLFAARQGNQ
jgi:hypothetical protein